MKMKAVSFKHASLKRTMLLFLVLAMAILPVLTAYAASSPDIGKDKAKQIALQDAGVKKSKVKKLKCTLENDHVRKYEVTFRTGKYNYEYAILPKTGGVVEMEKKIRKIGKERGSSALSKKKAKKTAMKEAGAKTVSKLKIKKSKYRGVRIWKIEFRADGNDYEYKIGLYTGRILEKERELDDKKY